MRLRSLALVGILFAGYGWVSKPGSFDITPGMTVLGAITAAGGAMFSSKVELKRTEHGSRVSIPVDLSKSKMAIRATAGPCRRRRIGASVRDRRGSVRDLYFVQQIRNRPLYGPGGNVMKQLSPYIVERPVDAVLPYRPIPPGAATDDMAGIGLAECWKVMRWH